MKTPSSPPHPAARTPYDAPCLRREARLDLVTAGSFDLVIPNPPAP